MGLKFKKILVITPILPEYHAAREVFGGKELFSEKNCRLAEKEIRECRIRILQSGMGRTLRIPYKKQLETFQPDLVIDSGSCGSLRGDLLPGAILFSRKVINESGAILSGDLLYDDLRITCDCRDSVMLEVAEPVISQDRRDALSDKYDADACSMESYRVAEAADDHSIDWVSFRIVTDFSNELTPGDFKKNIRRFSLELYKEIYKFLK